MPSVVIPENCIICGKPVTDINEGDVPFHVECWVKKIHEGDEVYSESETPKK